MMPPLCQLLVVALFGQAMVPPRRPSGSPVAGPQQRASAGPPPNTRHGGCGKNNTPPRRTLCQQASSQSEADPPPSSKPSRSQHTRRREGAGVRGCGLLKARPGLKCTLDCWVVGGWQLSQAGAGSASSSGSPATSAPTKDTAAEGTPAACVFSAWGPLRGESPCLSVAVLPHGGLAPKCGE